ncbi:MAG: hypothetical protein OXC18_22840 [Desulfurellaceae bacterium]|nr:hypothetical protein [Desulfurellaceae bacterium]
MEDVLIAGNLVKHKITDRQILVATHVGVFLLGVLLGAFLVWATHP